MFLPVVFFHHLNPQKIGFKYLAYEDVVQAIFKRYSLVAIIIAPRVPFDLIKFTEMQKHCFFLRIPNITILFIEYKKCEHSLLILRVHVDE